MLTFEKRVAALWNCGAIKLDFEKGFTFSIHEESPDLPRSPIKIDLRTPEHGGNLTTELIDDLGELLWTEARDSGLQFDGLVGIPNAGVPLADAMRRAAENENKFFPTLTLSKEIIGGKRTFTLTDDAELDPTNLEESRNNRVLIADDVFTHGLSKRRVAEVIIDAGYAVEDIIVVFDRAEADNHDFGNLQALGITRIARCSTLLEFIDESLVQKFISKKQHERIVAAWQKLQS